MRIVINYESFCALLQKILSINDTSVAYLYISFMNIIEIEGINLTSYMNTYKVCLNCGSSDLVSDRSLGGKMVCFKCGSSSFKNKSYSQRINKKFIYFIIGLIILLIVII